MENEGMSVIREWTPLDSSLYVSKKFETVRYYLLCLGIPWEPLFVSFILEKKKNKKKTKPFIVFLWASVLELELKSKLTGIFLTWRKFCIIILIEGGDFSILLITRWAQLALSSRYKCLQPTTDWFTSLPSSIAQ